MRLDLAVVVLTSSLGVGALRPRLPSAPPYPIAPASNSSSYGLTGTSGVPSSSSSWTSTANTPPSSTPGQPTGYASSSSSRYTPTGYSTPSSSPHKPTGHSQPPSGNHSQLPSGKCSGQTLNVLGASLDWWYTRTLYNVVSTISLQYNANHSQTGWTILPATTPFDLSSAMASPICSSTLTFNTYWNISLWDTTCTPAPTPVAASTTVITQTAFKQLNATTGTGRGFPNVVKTPPPATFTLPSSAGTYAEGTPFVYFSAYEIMTKTLSTYGNGSVGCAQATQTYQMATPFSFEYTDGNVNGSEVVGADVTGDVNPAFLQVVSASKAVAGSWVAAPTVAVVVQDIYAAEAVFAAAAGPLLTTQTVLQTPQPTLPSGFTTGPPETGFPSIGFTGHVQSTAPSLAGPTPINTGGGKTTKPGKPGPRPTHTEGGQPSPTHHGGRPTNTKDRNTSPTHDGGRPTNTDGGHNSPTHGGGKTKPGSGPEGTKTKGAFNHLISAIISAATPTNALQVLQQAKHTFTTHDSPTAAAIVKGISPGGSNDHKNRVDRGPDGKPIVVIGGTTITANSRTEFNIGTATLTPGGKVVVSGTTVSLASGLTVVVVNGHTHTAPQAVITPAPVLTIGGTTITPTNGPTYVVGGQTLSPGGVITVHGTTLSLGPGGSSIVVNGLTQELGSASPASITAPPVLTIGGKTFTAINNGYTYVINGQTLTPGELETVTVNGKTYVISLAHGATVLVIETEGPNGKVTATSYETLYSGSGSRPTITNTVGVIGASSASRPSAPSQSASLQGSASSLTIQLSTICVALFSLILALWL